MYFFGITASDGTIRYVTLDSLGQPYKLLPCSISPSEVDIDNGGEENDARAFYFYPRSSSGLLVSASNPRLYARLSKNTGKVVADNEGDDWTLAFI